MALRYGLRNIIPQAIRKREDRVARREVEDEGLAVFRLVRLPRAAAQLIRRAIVVEFGIGARGDGERVWARLLALLLADDHDAAVAQIVAARLRRRGLVLRR